MPAQEAMAVMQNTHESRKTDPRVHPLREQHPAQISRSSSRKRTGLGSQPSPSAEVPLATSTTGWNAEVSTAVCGVVVDLKSSVGGPEILKARQLFSRQSSPWLTSEFQTNTSYARERSPLSTFGTGSFGEIGLTTQTKVSVVRTAAALARNLPQTRRFASPSAAGPCISNPKCSPATHKPNIQPASLPRSARSPTPSSPLPCLPLTVASSTLFSTSHTAESSRER